MLINKIFFTTSFSFFFLQVGMDQEALVVIRSECSEQRSLMQLHRASGTLSLRL